MARRLQIGLAPPFAQRGAGHRTDAGQAGTLSERVPDRVEEEADRRGGRERDVVGSRYLDPLCLGDRLGYGLIQRDYVDLGAAPAQAVREHIPSFSGPRHQCPRDRHIDQRVHQPFGHEPLGHDVGDHPVVAQGSGGSGTDRRHPSAGEGARVASLSVQALEQDPGTVGAGQANQVVAL